MKRLLLALALTLLASPLAAQQITGVRVKHMARIAIANVLDESGIGCLSGRLYRGKVLIAGAASMRDGRCDPTRFIGIVENCTCSWPYDGPPRSGFTLAEMRAFADSPHLVRVRLCGFADSTLLKKRVPVAPGRQAEAKS